MLKESLSVLKVVVVVITIRARSCHQLIWETPAAWKAELKSLLKNSREFTQLIIE